MARHKPIILIIDDDPDFINGITPILESVMEDTVTALNHKEGKENIFAERPDLILLDIMMDSFFDSFSLCCAIKTSKEYIEFKNTYEEKNSGNGKTH